MALNLAFNGLVNRATAQTATGSLDVPQTVLTPLGGVPSNSVPGTTLPPNNFGRPPAATTGPPPPQFDPYAGAPSSGFVQPQTLPPLFGGNSFLGAPNTATQQGGMFPPATPPTGMGTPVYGGLANQPPPLIGGPSTFGGTSNGLTGSGGFFGAGGPLGGSPVLVPSGASPYSGPVYGGPMLGTSPGYGVPPSALPNSAPSTLFPGGLFGTSAPYSPSFNPYRIIQRGRFRHTFLFGGDSPDDLEINNTDVALAFAFPRFFFSNQPLFFAPSFSLHLWDGPNASTGADLPSNAYSAFIDFAWNSDPNRIIGAELSTSVGVFSEFDIFRSESLRVRGKGLGTVRISPASTFKAGVYYYDRVDVKLLPAVGLFWRPSPFTRADIFFPQPKFSRYVSTLGTNDLWWYVSGDYGGGSWTIDRDDGREDQVDLNDIRLMLGFEWGPSERMRAGVRTGFFEFGYVFDREIVYRNNPMDNLSIDDTWMVRLGIGY